MNHIDKQFNAAARRIRAEQAGSPKTIHIDGPIGQEPGEVSAKWFRAQLPSDGSPFEVRFHSEGGSLFEAFGIHDTITAHRGRKTAVVESMAFSASSLLLCAFDDVAVTENSYTMLHAPYFDSDDTPKGEQSLLDSLRKRMINIYAAKTRKPIATITRLIDQETFFDAEASVSLGIANRIIRSSSAVMARMPARVLAKIQSASPGSTATARWRAAVSACGSVSMADKMNPGLRLRMLNEVNGR